jgi:predicted Zn-dependent protease
MGCPARPAGQRKRDKETSLTLGENGDWKINGQAFNASRSAWRMKRQSPKRGCLVQPDNLIEPAVLKIGPPDLHYLTAARGWLELGNPAEATAELLGISQDFENDVAVLEVRWEIHAQQKNWSRAAEVSDRMIRHHPGLPSGWIGRSYCLHEMKQTREAFDSLLPASRKFLRVSIIPYNLACYACQLGLLAEAEVWLTQAISLGKKEDIKEMALKDRDLEPLQHFLASL